MNAFYRFLMGFCAIVFFILAMCNYHPDGYYNGLSYLFWILFAVCFILLIKTLLGRRKRILKFVAQYRNPFFNPSKKTEQAIWNKYLGIDPLSGNMLFVDFDKKQVVAIDWNCWRGYLLSGDLTIKLKNLKTYDSITEVKYIGQERLGRILSLMTSNHYERQKNGSLVQYCRDKGLKYADIFNV